MKLYPDTQEEILEKSILALEKSISGVSEHLEMLASINEDIKKLVVEHLIKEKHNPEISLNPEIKKLADEISETYSMATEVRKVMVSKRDTLCGDLKLEKIKVAFDKVKKSLKKYEQK